MANETLEKNNGKETAKKMEEQGQKNKKGLPIELIAVITALAIIAGVIFGVSYLVVRNNVGGIAVRYKDNIKSIPLLSMALPKPADPDDPKNLTDEEIRKKYTDMKKQRDELSKKVNELNKKTAEIDKYKSNEDKVNAAAEKIKKDAEAKVAQVQKDKAQLASDMDKFNQMVAAADTEGFRNFYEKFDKETSQKIYSEIIKNENADKEAIKFAKLYEGMDPSAAGKIFEQMGETKIGLIVETLKNMKKESSAEVLAAMDAAFASKVSAKLREAYKK